MTRNNKTKPADPYAETMAKIRAQIGEEEWKKLTLAAAEEKRASDERARKLAAERERKVAEETRKQKAVEEYVRKRDEREHAQKELEDFSTLLIRSDYDEDKMAEILERLKIYDFMESLEKVMEEKTQLTEGFMPVMAIDNSLTKKIKKTIL